MYFVRDILNRILPPTYLLHYLKLFLHSDLYSSSYWLTHSRSISGKPMHYAMPIQLYPASLSSVYFYSNFLPFPWFLWKQFPFSGALLLFLIFEFPHFLIYLCNYLCMYLCIAFYLSSRTIWDRNNISYCQQKWLELCAICVYLSPIVEN